jgi:hypothetical protein
MDEPKKHNVFFLEFFILLLFLISIFASIWGFYQTSIGQGCMDGMYLIYGIMATFVTGLLSLIITLVRFFKIRPAYRIMGLLPAVYIIGLLLISMVMRLISAFD